MYSFICIVGVIGNLLLLLAISKVTLMRKITKKLVVNLVIIDLLINVIQLPNDIVDIIHPGTVYFLPTTQSIIHFELVYLILECRKWSQRLLINQLLSLRKESSC